MISIIGHEDIQKRLLCSVQQKTWGKALLFQGIKGIGKGTLARYLVATALQQEGETLEQSYEYMESGMHPDVYIVRAFDDKKTCNVEQMQEMIYFTQKAPVMGAEKYVIVDALDDVHYTARDAMLKCLESHQDVHFILVSHAPQFVTATIRSRSQVINFSALSEKQFAQCFPEKDADHAQKLFMLSGGSPGFSAVLLLDDHYVACEDMLTLLRHVWEAKVSVEVEVMRLASQKQPIAYDALRKVLENVSAYVSVGRGAEDFCFLPKVLPFIAHLLSDALVYHTSWNSFVWGLYSICAQFRK